jgi:hypothetical protein
MVDDAVKEITGLGKVVLRTWEWLVSCQIVSAELRFFLRGNE